MRTGPGHKGMILSDKGAFVGIVQVDTSRNVIVALEVNPAYRRLGIASWLLEYAEDNLGANKLSVRKTNKPAIDLYTSRGYIDYKTTDSMLFKKIAALRLRG